MSQLELYARFAALQLTGKRVQVYFREPTIAGASGSAWMDESGERIIEVKPNGAPEHMLYLFLHELAHHESRHVLRRMITPEPGAKVAIEPVLHNPARADLEQEADSLALRWMAQAGDGDLLSRLKRLALNPMIDDFRKRGMR